MGPTTLAERLTAQLTPIAELMDASITLAYERYSIKALRTKLPDIARDAHRARASGLLVWQHVADGLVALAAADRLPEGFAILTSDKQHNSGRYLLRFPGGLLTIRRAPHDDDKDEGQFMQESFVEMTKELDKAALPDDQEAARVWLKIAPDGGSTFAAEDRHGHQVKVPLADLLAASTPPVAVPTQVPATTQVRSRLRSDEQSDAQ
jgi:hypothetical protein